MSRDLKKAANPSKVMRLRARLSIALADPTGRILEMLAAYLIRQAIGGNAGAHRAINSREVRRHATKCDG